LPKDAMFLHYLSSHKQKTKNSVALRPRAKYTERATATCRRNLVPTFADIGLSLGQRGGSPTVVNLNFLDGYLSSHCERNSIRRYSLLWPLHVGHRTVLYSNLYCTYNEQSTEIHDIDFDTISNEKRIDLDVKQKYLHNPISFTDFFLF
jgi:hypothetical protein